MKSVHEGIISAKCKHCDKTFMTKNALREHMKNVQEVQGLNSNSNENNPTELIKSNKMTSQYHLRNRVPQKAVSVVQLHTV